MITLSRSKSMPCGNRTLAALKDRLQDKHANAIARVDACNLVLWRFSSLRTTICRKLKWQFVSISSILVFIAFLHIPRYPSILWLIHPLKPSTLSLRYPCLVSVALVFNDWSTNVARRICPSCPIAQRNAEGSTSHFMRRPSPARESLQIYETPAEGKPASAEQTPCSRHANRQGTDEDGVHWTHPDFCQGRDGSSAVSAEVLELMASMTGFFVHQSFVKFCQHNWNASRHVYNNLQGS